MIHDILSLAASHPRKTRIIYQANLNFSIARPYLQFLISKGYMARDDGDKKGDIFYQLTEEGQQLLALLEQVEVRLNGLFN